MRRHLRCSCEVIHLDAQLTSRRSRRGDEYHSTSNDSSGQYIWPDPGWLSQGV